MNVAKPFVIALALIALATSPLQATVVTWDNGGSGSDWGTDANWDTDTQPVAGDRAYLFDGSTTTVTSSGELFSQMRIAGSTLNVTGGSLTGDSGAGSEHFVYLGRDTGGSAAAGFLNISGGTLTSQRHVYVGFSSGSGGSTLTLSDLGTLSFNHSDSRVFIGVNADGVFNQTGGTFSGSPSGRIQIGRDGTGTASGVYNLSGGSVTANSFIFGDDGPGTFNVIGPDATISFSTYEGQSNGTLTSDIDGLGISNIDVSGAVTLAGTYTLTDSGAAPGTYSILTGSSIAGAFDTINLPSGWTSSLSSDTFSVTLVAVPEPSAFLFFSIGGLALCGKRRRNRINLTVRPKKCFAGELLRLA